MRKLKKLMFVIGLLFFSIGSSKMVTNDYSKLILNNQPAKSKKNRIILDSFSYDLDNDSCYTYNKRGDSYYILHGTKSDPKIIIDIVLGNNIGTDGTYEVIGAPSMKSNQAGVALEDNSGYWLSSSGTVTVSHVKGLVSVTIENIVLTKTDYSGDQKTVSGNMTCM